MRAPDEGVRPVQVVRARGAGLAERERRATRFTLCAPTPRPAGATLRWRVVDRGSVAAPAVAVAPTGGGCVAVRLTVAGGAGARVVVAKQVYVGWSTGVPVVHLRLHFDRLLVRRAMDPSCSPDDPGCKYKNESTLLGQIAAAPGEWQLQWSVDGIWGRWPGTLAAEGRVGVPRSPDRRLLRPRRTSRGRSSRWRGSATSAPCRASTGPATPSCRARSRRRSGTSTGDDYPGAVTVTFRSLPQLGRHVSNASTAGSSCPPANAHGCYQLGYTVERVR